MTTVQTGPTTDSPMTIGGRSFRSRLIVGTGKYRNNGDMVAAIEASGAEIVTVAVRRVDLDRTKEQGILYHLDPDQYFLLANTAGCYTADEAVRYARLAREAGFNDFVKLEVIGDRETLLPDTEGLLTAARELAAEGFKVLAYTNDDLITALRLEDAGLRRGHAAGLADRQRPRPAQSLRHPHHQAPALGAGHRRCRRRNRIGCLPDHGAGRGRDPDEHRAGRGRRSGRHGARDAPGGRSRASGVPRRPDASPRGRGAHPAPACCEEMLRLCGSIAGAPSCRDPRPRRAALDRSSRQFASGAPFEVALDRASAAARAAIGGWPTSSPPASCGSAARSTPQLAPLVPRGPVERRSGVCRTS